jgi:integrase
MPRCVNRNPRYSKHKASGQAVVTVDGKDFYLGPWNSKTSKVEYDRLIGQWLAGGRHLPTSDAQDISVAEVIERYMQFAKTYYRRSDGTTTGEVYLIKAALRPVNQLFGASPAVEFGPLALDCCRQAMIQKNWSRSTINNHVTRVKGVFKWATAQQLIPPSVHQALATVGGLRQGRSQAKERGPVRPVADEIIETTLPHLTSIVAAMVQLQRLTGARPGEICAMRVGEIDRSGDVWSYRPASHKTAFRGHHRLIPIGPKAQAILTPFPMKLDPQAYLFSPASAMAEVRRRRSENRTTPINQGNGPGSNVKRRPRCRPGDHYNVAAYRHAIARACDLAFPPPKDICSDPVKAKAWCSEHRWNPHRLRHSAATEIRRRFGIEAAQQVLGHATLSATELYAEQNAEAAQRIAAAIG